MNIIHITPHLGGGVGKVLINWACQDHHNKNFFLCFGYCNDEQIKEYSNIENIKVLHSLSNEEVLKEIKKIEHDFIIIHYWNFPLLLNFLLNYTLPKCRLVIWSHTLGKFPPYVIPKQIRKFCDKFINTSLASYKANNKNTILSTMGIDVFLSLEKKEHKGFNILYVGTLDFSKMSEDFIEICNVIIKEINDVHFYICGTGCSEQELKSQVTSLEIEKYFTFTGWVDNVNDYISISDLFLYPLSKQHFGTGEQVVAQSMASGIIPIMYDNPTERQILGKELKHLLSKNKKDIIKKVVFFYENKNIRDSYIIKLKERAEELYSMNTFLKAWNNVFESLKDKPKKERRIKFKRITNLISSDSFIFSLGKYGKIFAKNNIKKIKKLYLSNKQWFSKNKGSIKQYVHYDNTDEYLQNWLKLLPECEEEHGNRNKNN